MSSLFTAVTARVSVKAICAVVLLLIFGVALALRVCFPYDNVFVGEWVRFGLNDPWYHMRIVENLVQHFPQRIGFDAYSHFPWGQWVPFAPFFDLLLGFVIWVVGLGSPTQHTVEVIGAYFPAVLGALVTVPVYFIGKLLFNRGVGLLAAGLIAILPGEFLFRSLLGFTDHHVAEVLFSTTAALFLIMAIRKANENEITFGHIWRRDWRNSLKPLIYALLTGIALGVYLLSWVGALLFVFIVAAYLLVQYVIDHLRRKSTDYLAIIGVPSFLIPLLMVAPITYPPYPGKQVVIVALLAGFLAVLGATGLSRLMAFKNLKPIYYPVALLVLGLVGLGVFYAIEPTLPGSMIRRFGMFAPGVEMGTISEVQSLLTTFGRFSLANAWNYFTTGFFLAFIGLGIAVYVAVKERNAEKAFLIVWSVIMLAAALGQRRFGYYYAVNVALLTAYVSWKALEWAGMTRVFVRRTVEPAEGTQDRTREGQKGKDRRKKAKKRGTPRRPIASRLGPKYLQVALAAVVIFFAVFYPNIPQAINTASHPSGPDPAWHSSLVWMRDNTPEPFGDPDFYYELYAAPALGQAYDYPESAYGVMSWWDYGHWIARIAHRIPNANPFQDGAREAAHFFTAQDEASASEMLDKLGSRYVIIDYPMSTSKFYAMPIWLGESESQFFETYFQKTAEGRLEPIRVYYPPYYQSMCARLYNFGGQAVVPENSTWVISYVEKTDEQGNRYKEITGVANDGKPFATYQEANAYLGNQTSPNYRIVGPNPFASPVPLEELEHFELIYQSAEADPFVRIFEYSPSP